MRTTIRYSKGSQLPEAWAEQAGIDPDQEVDIAIIDRKKSMGEFRRLARTIGKRVEEYGGLTEEDIQKEVDTVRAERSRVAADQQRHRACLASLGRASAYKVLLDEQVASSHQAPASSRQPP